jgi:hypothetical protein
MMGMGYYIYGPLNFFGNILQLPLSSVAMTVCLSALVYMHNAYIYLYLNVISFLCTAISISLNRWYDKKNTFTITTDQKTGCYCKVSSYRGAVGQITGVSCK